MTQKIINGIEWLAAYLLEQVILLMVLGLMSFVFFHPMYDVLGQLTFHGTDYSIFKYPILLVGLVPIGYAIDHIRASEKRKRKTK